MGGVEGREEVGVHGDDEGVDVGCDGGEGQKEAAKL